MDGLKDSIQKITFRKRAFQRMLRIDHCFRDGVDPIQTDEVRKFSRLDAIGCDVVAFHRKLVGQADRPWTVGSGRRDKNFQMDRLRQPCKLFLAFQGKTRLAS